MERQGHELTSDGKPCDQHMAVLKDTVRTAVQVGLVDQWRRPSTVRKSQSTQPEIRRTREKLHLFLAINRAAPGCFTMILIVSSPF